MLAQIIVQIIECYPFEKMAFIIKQLIKTCRNDLEIITLAVFQNHYEMNWAVIKNSKNSKWKKDYKELCQNITFLQQSAGKLVQQTFQPSYKNFNSTV